jgi:hypothetical protein
VKEPGGVVLALPITNSEICVGAPVLPCLDKPGKSRRCSRAESRSAVCGQAPLAGFRVGSIFVEICFLRRIPTAVRANREAGRASITSAARTCAFLPKFARISRLTSIKAPIRANFRCVFDRSNLPEPYHYSQTLGQARKVLDNGILMW